MRAFILAAVLLALPSLAGATTFHKESSCSTEADPFTVDGAVIKGLAAGQTIYNCQSGNSDMFVALVPFTVEYDPADDSTGTDEGEIYLRGCSENTVTSNFSCERVFIDNDGDNILDEEPLNGDPGPIEQRRWLWSLDPGLYYIEEVTAEGSGNNGITKITAKVPAN